MNFYDPLVYFTTIYEEALAIESMEGGAPAKVEPGDEDKDNVVTLDAFRDNKKK